MTAEKSTYSSYVTFQKLHRGYIKCILKCIIFGKILIKYWHKKSEISHENRYSRVFFWHWLMLAEAIHISWKNQSKLLFKSFRGVTIFKPLTYSLRRYKKPHLDTSCLQKSGYSGWFWSEYPGLKNPYFTLRCRALGEYTNYCKYVILFNIELSRL